MSSSFFTIANRTLIYKILDQCTFTLTGEEFVIQDYYRCETCNFTENNHEGVCSVCVKRCHAGHDVKYNGKMRAYCDCGAKKDGSCCALVREEKDMYIGMYD